MNSGWSHNCGHLLGAALVLHDWSSDGGVTSLRGLHGGGAARLLHWRLASTVHGNLEGVAILERDSSDKVEAQKA